MSFAALSTVIAVIENIISMSMDNFGWSRKKSVAVNFVGITLLSIPAVLGWNVLSNVQPLGAGTNIMDLEDFIVSYNVLPLGSMLVVMFCTRKNGWGFEGFVNEADTGKGIKFPKFMRGYMTYVLPLIVLGIYFKGYYDMFKNESTKTLVIWMGVAVVLAGFVLWVGMGKRSDGSKR
jgi:NSS family neurotransmitter:Na+ symporter